jgi:hypothetical protein
MEVGQILISGSIIAIHSSVRCQCARSFKHLDVFFCQRYMEAYRSYCPAPSLLSLLLVTVHKIADNFCDIISM